MFFKDIAGYDAIKSQLIKSVHDGHVSHALLFHGADGSGHMPLAVAFGGYVLCQNPTDNDRCGECAPCRQVSALSHPDLHISFPIVISEKEKKTKSADYFRDFSDMLRANAHFTLENWELESAGENKKAIIPVAESDEITKALSLKSFMGGHKVMIIWMAERMNQSSANKLLKTLEEPTSKTIVILVVSKLDHLLPTVISRTQRISLPPLEASVISEALKHRHNVSEDRAMRIARQSEGNYGAALKLLGDSEQQELFFTLFSGWMRACVKRDPAACLDVSEQIAALKRERGQKFMEYALEFLHKCVVHQYLGDSYVHFSEKEDAFAARFAPYITGADIEEMQQILSKGHYHIERNANALALFMKLSYDMMRIFAAYEKSKTAQ